MTREFEINKLVGMLIAAPVVYFIWHFFVGTPTKDSGASPAFNEAFQASTEFKKLVEDYYEKNRQLPASPGDIGRQLPPIDRTGVIDSIELRSYGLVSITFKPTVYDAGVINLRPSPLEDTGELEWTCRVSGNAAIINRPRSCK